MKYIVFSETSADYKEIPKRKQIMEERKKNPEKYPKILFPLHRMGGGPTGKSFAVVEATEEQIMNAALLWGPLVKLEWVPIYEIDDQ